MRRRKRVLFLLPQLKQGGAEMVVLNIIRGIDRSMLAPFIAWFHGERLYPFSVLKDVPMFFLDKKDGLDLTVWITIYKIIQENGIEVVNSHHFMPLFYSFVACKMSKCKLIYTEHSVWEAYQRRGGWKIISQFLLRRTNAVIGVSPEITAFFRQRYGLSNERARTILNGIDTQRFSPVGNNRGFRELLGLDENDILIGMTGNFRKVKNHLLLIRSFADVRLQFHKAKLVLIGQGFPSDTENSEREVRKLVKAYQLENQVIFLGYRDDVHRILPCLDIFCLTSLREGLPLSLIEAMACGLPVVGTNVEGIRIVIDPGRNGFLVDPSDSAGLAHALTSLISNRRLREQMGKESHEDALRYYSLARFSGQYNHLFASVT